MAGQQSSGLEAAQRAFAQRQQCSLSEVRSMPLRQQSAWPSVTATYDVYLLLTLYTYTIADDHASDLQQATKTAQASY